MNKLWMTVPLALSLLLMACGGGGSGGSTGGSGSGGSTPAPVPDPNTSSISGALSFPGAPPPVTKAADVAGNLGDLGRVYVGDSWWTRPAEVLSRMKALGVDERGVIPGEYIVKRRAGVSVSQSLSAGGVTLRLKPGLSLPGTALYTTENSSALSPLAFRDVARALSARPDVEYAEPNRWMHAFAAPNDKLFPLQWDSPAMNLPAAWVVSTGKAVTVGVVDTGIVKHPDLVANVLPGLDLVADGTGTTFDTDPTDEGGTEYHGSHVAGTIAAATNNGEGVAGVDWGAKIVPVRVLSAQGGSVTSILLGTLWAAGYDLTKQGLPLNPNPAKVINLSLGGPGPCSQSEQDVFDLLNQTGVIVVVAAGNENQDANNASPANCKGVIAVGATGPDGTRAPYSNYGSRIDVMAPGGDSTQKIKVGGTTLPGGILSTVADDSQPGSFTYALLDGTSMASPHVAGLVALLKGEQPSLTAAQALARLKATSTPLSDAACGVKAGCGAGLVNAAAALGASTPTPTPTPVPTPTPTPVGSIKTYVAALFQLPQGFDESRSQLVVMDQQSLNDPYKLSGLVAGTYQVAGWQDVDGNGKVDAGEPFGIYVGPKTGKSGVTIDAVSRSIIGINVQLKPAQVQSLGTLSAVNPVLRLALEAQARAASRPQP